MTYMMHNTGFTAGFTFLWGLHALSVAAFFTGIVFFVILAAKTFNAALLKKWAVGLVVAGTLACLLTIGIKGGPWTDGMQAGAGMMQVQRMGMMEKMMNRMMKDDDGRADTDDKGMMGGGTMGMSMDDMSMSLEGKTGDDFDKAFIEGMIPHHQGAIEMAKMAQASAKHAEIKAMAENIIAAQQAEIDRLKQWQRDWGYNE